MIFSYHIKFKFHISNRCAFCDVSYQQDWGPLACEVPRWRLKGQVGARSGLYHRVPWGDVCLHIVLSLGKKNKYQLNFIKIYAGERFKCSPRWWLFVYIYKWTMNFIFQLRWVIQYCTWHHKVCGLCEDIKTIKSCLMPLSKSEGNTEKWSWFPTDAFLGAGWQRTLKPPNNKYE